MKVVFDINIDGNSAIGVVRQRSAMTKDPLFMNPRSIGPRSIGPRSIGPRAISPYGSLVHFMMSLM